MTNRLRPPQGAPACSGGPTSVSDAEAGLGTRRELAVCVQSNSSLSTLILNNSKHNYTTNHSGGWGGVLDSAEAGVVPPRSRRPTRANSPA